MEASAVFFDNIHKVDKQLASRRIAIAGDVLPVQLGAYGMHHHARVHVVDPEVFAAAVTQLGDGLQRAALCLFLADCALDGLVVVVGQDAVGDFHGLAYGTLTLLGQHVAFGVAQSQ